MESEIKVFKNAEFGSVRTVIVDGVIYFVGKDVADILGYSETAKAIREHVDNEDRGVSKIDTPGGKQKMTIINESGLYSLILSSKLANAKKFKRWVTSEVLPSIRKTGTYSIQNSGNELSLDNLLKQMKTIMTLADELEDIRTIRHNAECANMLVKVLEKKVKRLEEKTACAKPFTPPTLSEVEDYCEACDVRIDAEKFYYYYESIGWTVKGKRITNWKARAKYWERNDDNDD